MSNTATPANRMVSTLRTTLCFIIFLLPLAGSRGAGSLLTACYLLSSRHRRDARSRVQDDADRHTTLHRCCQFVRGRWRADVERQADPLASTFQAVLCNKGLGCLQNRLRLLDHLGSARSHAAFKVHHYRGAAAQVLVPRLGGEEGERIVFTCVVDGDGELLPRLAAGEGQQQQVATQQPVQW